MSKKTPSIFNLSEKVAVITGGAGMLGKMHAEIIAEAGGIPILADVRGTDAKVVAEGITNKYGIPALEVETDITSKKEVENLRDVILKKFGRIDILINNAANDPKVKEDVDGAMWTRFENFAQEIWEKDISVGLTGAFLCAQVLGTEMAQKRSGVIVNISSDLGLIAPDQRLYEQEGLPPGEQPVKPVTYSVIKTALIGLTRYLSTYWAKQGVRVNVLCPGGIEADQSEEFLDRVKFRIPMGRMARKDEYKGAILFLASEASSYMNGSVMVVDGGRSCW